VGTSVTLTGSNLTGAIAVTFAGPSNNTVTTGLTVSGTGSNQTITMAVPSGAQTGNVTVTTPSGISNGLAFNALATPLALASTSPTANARAAAATTAVTATFNQAVTSGSATALKVFSAQRGGLRTGSSGSTTVSGSTVSFVPTYAFKPGERVQATITTAATAATGGSLAAARVVQFTTAAMGGTGTFSGGSDPAVGNSPSSVAVGDVDGDGDLDLLTANLGAATVSVRLNNGSGVFSGGSDPAVSNNPASVALGDVDGDGDLDLLAACSGTVSVRLNNGSGVFSGGSNPAVTGIPANVAVGDVDGDGDLDLLATTTNSTSNTVSVRLNNGSGVFSGGSDPVVGNQPYRLAVGDVDGDGDLDLLTANYGGATVSVRLNNGSGLFSGGSDPAVGSSPQSVAVGDVDGDGDLDLLTANQNGGTVSVRLNNGSGVFSGGSDPTVGSNPFSVALGDVDGDGDLDLLVANASSSTVSVRLNNGSGVFSGGSDPAVGRGPTSVAVGDVDGDGDLDLLTANQTSSTVSVRLNQNAVPLISSLSPTSGPLGTSVTLTGTNLTGATGVSFGGTAATTFTVVNGTTITATVPTGAASGAVSVTTPGGTATGPTFTVITNLVVTTTTPIQPGTYNSITVNSPGVGTLGGNVTVTTSLTVNNGATLNDGCAIISGVGSFTLAAGGTLGICDPAGITGSGASGAVQVTGTRSFSPDASYVYNGMTTQSTGSGLPAQVRNLSTTNASNVTLTSSTSATQVVTVGNAGNLLLDGTTLTLLSTSAGTALVVNADSGRVRGVAVVQRYIDGSLNSGPGYRHFSVPVIGTTLADFATSSFTPVLNPAFNSSPTPAAVTPFPNLYIYDQSALASRTNNLSAFDKGWLSPGSLNNPTGPGRGYCLNLSAGQVVDVTGTLFSNALTVSLSRTSGATAADGGWALIGNPYPAPLDLSLVQASDRQNLDAATYVVQSTGQYAGGYRAYVNGVSTSASNNPLLAMGQGFFTRVSAGQTTGSFTFRNAQRVTSYASQATFQRPTADPRPQVRLELAGAGLADGWVAYAEAGATPAFDSQLDAGKLPNSTGLNLSSISLLGDNLAIDGQSAFTAATVLPLAVGVPAAGTYSLSATALNNLPAGLSAYLRDSQTGQTVLLAAGTSYSFSVTAAQAATLLTGRFTLLFRPQAPLATVIALTATDVTVYPNPAHASFTVALPGVAGASAVQAELLNALGQVVRRQSATLPTAGTAFTMPTADLAAGVYVLRLQAGTTTLTKRVVVQ
jgi:hypothetical protein